MTITRLKTKNQITIPTEIAKRLNLRKDELFVVELEDNSIKLTPVDIEPRYSPQELSAIDNIVLKEKDKAKVVKPGKKFKNYIKKIAK